MDFTDKEKQMIIDVFKPVQVQGIDNMKTIISIVEKCEEELANAERIEVN